MKTENEDTTKYQLLIRIKHLKEEIEQLKCCGNCKNFKENESSGEIYCINSMNSQIGSKSWQFKCNKWENIISNL